MLHEEIKGGIKDAMLAKDAVRLRVLRNISAAATNELVAKGRMPQDLLTDEEVLQVITKLAKQRKDSIEQYTKGGRPELAEEEQSELKVLETYLPTLMSAEEVLGFAVKAKEALGITDKKDSGKLMAQLMRELKGKADGTVVKEVVDSIF